ncbi:transcription termination/antitermination protein NusA [bacterium NHP-B]|nr:transcription termination/antitermination protein NusA [bacterium NHP-B]
MEGTIRKIPEKGITLTQGLIRQEVLVAAQEIAREKGIDKDRIIASIEEALVKVAHLKYGEETPIRAAIHQKTGEISLLHVRTVVDDVTNPLEEISLVEAQAQKPSVQLGDTFEEPLPHMDFERVSAQVMRQVITRLIKEASREKEYAEYHDKAGEIVSGTVKSIDFGNVIIDLGQAEGVLLPEDTISRERFHPGDRIRAYVREVKQDPKGFQIFLSRSCSEFMIALFKQEVPEVYNGVIEIKAVARDPGSRAKIGVFSLDSSLDPVGACVGVRGNRVQAVTAELRDERIDVIRWSDDPFTFLVNALTPASVTKIVTGDKENAVQVVVPDDQQSLAIGRRGQNVRLASTLTGLHIDIVTESDDNTQRTQFTNALSEKFVNVLDIDDVMARFLIAEGFESIEDVAMVNVSELESLEGFTETLAQELQKRARRFCDEEMQKKIDTWISMGGQQDLQELSDLLSPDMLIKLAHNKVLTLHDFADLANDELLDILKEGLTREQADQLILEARDKTHAYDAQKT